MAIPDTNTFSLQDVITELSLADDEGLVECFDDSVDGDFDPAYKGSKNSLLNFRNYGGEQYWGYTAGTQSTITNICLVPMNQTIYQRHPTLQAFSFDDPIYTDTSGTLASASWVKISILYRYWDGTAWTGTTQSC